MDRGFTYTSPKGLLSSVGTLCHVSQAFDPDKGIPECKRTEFKALWDTGATKTVITQRAVKACGLKPIRTIRPILIQGVDGLEKSEAYTINLSLPNKITICNLTVVAKNPGDDVWWDVIIGMDIITTGDFALTNKGGVTMFSFRYPSKTHLDFHSNDGA